VDTKYAVHAMMLCSCVAPSSLHRRVHVYMYSMSITDSLDDFVGPEEGQGPPLHSGHNGGCVEEDFLSHTKLAGGEKEGISEQGSWSSLCLEESQDARV
jgi:hypothetical protein